MENKLFLQYLSGAGAAMGGEGSFAAGLNKITQQNIATQNYAQMVGKQQTAAKKRHQEYMSMMKELLGGGAKINMDKDNVSIKAPSALFGGEGGMSSLISGGAPAASGAGGPAAKQEFDVLNPSASPLDVSSADLAGLTPQNISQALQLGMASEELEGKKLSELMDMIYKRDVLATKDYRTPAQKNYEYAQSQGFEGSLVDFKNAAKTTHQKDYDAAVSGGYKGDFNTWMLEMAKAGAINLGEFAARKETTELVKRKSFFRTPKFRTDAEKIVDDSRRIEYETSDDPKKVRSKFVWEEMDKQIKTSYPDVVFGRDSKTGIVGWYDKSGKLVASWQ